MNIRDVKEILTVKKMGKKMYSGLVPFPPKS